MAILASAGNAEAIAPFFAPEACEEEFPNRLLQLGAMRDLDELKKARTRSLTFLSSEGYELLSTMAGGSTVALEIAWTGVVRRGTDLHVEGQKLAARLALFLQFRDGLIVSQRKYLCA